MICASLLSVSLFGTAAALTIAATPGTAFADGVCGGHAVESGSFGGFMACVPHNPRGRIFFVEI
ncbi:MAG: hypothetical protein QOF21_2202 [Actinomycetota bacterium]|jgi:bifunctional pyridoxal-dependent enzyme with beta-cystathionase and maltose regulon repressor activities